MKRFAKQRGARTSRPQDLKAAEARAQVAMAPWSEDKLVDETARRLLAEWRVVARAEVPVLGRVADIVFIQGTDVVTMEFKLTDWRRAIRQARDHRLAADFAYICMPERRLTGALHEALMEAGVGLAFCTPGGKAPFEIVIPAPRSTDVWKMARSVLWRYLQTTAPAGLKPALLQE